MKKLEILRSASKINLKLQNTTNSDILISLLSNLSNTGDISNQSTSFAWDLTGVPFEAYDAFTILFRNSQTTNPYVSVTRYYSIRSLTGLLDALNLLGVSSFFVDTTGGATIIKTYNDGVKFTDITLFSSNGYNTKLYYYGGGYVGTGGNYIFKQNGNSVFSGVFPVNIPLTNISNYFDPSLVSPTIEVTGTAGNATMMLTIKQIDLATGTTSTIFNNTYAAGAFFDTTFTANDGSAYEILFD